MQLDFAIIYEHKNRELENAFFMKKIIENMGYKCEVFPLHSLKRFFSDPKVLIVPFLYSNKECEYFNCFWKRRRRPIINLQYEQVLSKNSYNSDIYVPKEEAKLGMHIVWGDNARNRFIDKADINDNHVAKVGSLPMLLNTREYSYLHKSREYIAKEFGLDRNKKWHLFISSFNYASLSASELEQLKKELSHAEEFAVQNKTSRNILLDWFRNYCLENPDTIIIYRPHPNEYKDDYIVRMTKELPNFECISDYSIRQWIFVADSLSTWYSTAIVDAYFANVGCIVLRPEPIDENMDVDLMLGCELITTEKDFIEIMKRGYTIQDFPIETSKIFEYYNNKNSNEVIERFQECCNKVYNNMDEYAVRWRRRSKIKSIAINLLYDIAKYIPIFVFFRGSVRDWLKWHHFNTKDENKLRKKYQNMFQNLSN